MNDQIEIFKAKIKLKNIFICSFLGFLLAPGIVAMIIKDSNAISLLQIAIAFLTFVVFFSLLFFLIGILYNFSKKVVIYEDSIELMNPITGERNKIKWEQIDRVRFESDLFEHGFYLLTKDDNFQGVIPIPIKRFQRLIEILKSKLGEEHLLVSELTKTT
ncbi:MAG: hypothetical protein WC836_14455 [Desulfobacula sp.]|jgi:hypothetical protein